MIAEREIANNIVKSKSRYAKRLGIVGGIGVAVSALAIAGCTKEGKQELTIVVETATVGRLVPAGQLPTRSNEVYLTAEAYHELVTTPEPVKTPVALGEPFKLSNDPSVTFERFEEKYDSSRKYVLVLEGRIPRGVNYVRREAGSETLINSKESLLRAIAPIEDPRIAIAYLLATDEEIIVSFEGGTPLTWQDDETTNLTIWERPLFGCSHPTKEVGYVFGKNGEYAFKTGEKLVGEVDPGVCYD